MNPIQRSQVSQSDSQQSQSLGSRTIASSGEIWIAIAIDVKPLLNSFIEWISNHCWNNMYALSYSLLLSLRFLPLKPFGKMLFILSSFNTSFHHDLPTRSTFFYTYGHLTVLSFVLPFPHVVLILGRLHKCKIAEYLIEHQ